MANDTQTTRTPAAPEGTNQPPRLKLKPQAATTGQVDGAWWPRSRDMAAELPTLLTDLAARLGRVERVSYNLAAWAPTARKITIGGAVVRLGGYRTQHPDTVDVLGARQQLTLLVVPPEASPQAARRALNTAAQPGNTDGIAELLTAQVPPPRAAPTTADETERPPNGTGKMIDPGQVNTGLLHLDQAAGLPY